MNGDRLVFHDFLEWKRLALESVAGMPLSPARREILPTCLQVANSLAAYTRPALM
jgi:hypothetical protein